jgi:hypothetical protein
VSEAVLVARAFCKPLHLNTLCLLPLPTVLCPVSYACLAGLAYTPDFYCCGVDIVGPSHVKTLLSTIPAYWAPLKRMLIDRIGDAEADDALNRK